MGQVMQEQEFWSIPTHQILQQLSSSAEQGLTSKEAEMRLSAFGN
ncbi:MAG TPA: cation-transporting P-type ATPase [Nitrososphaeraceae archaeon]|nr:cation-transporting P-type ATPase [Nitrososphaeraceae archaeon]